VRLRPTICALAIATATVVVAVPAAPASARPTPAAGPEHCVADVVGRLDTGELLLGPARCSTDEVQASAFTTSGATTTHYDGANLTGATLTIAAGCSGSWANLPTDWRTGVSSTSTPCSVVRQYSGLNLTGSVELTYAPWDNLVTVNNAADSVRYG
jgi:hypothetical protein